jgi:hypothetical protein
VGRYTDGNGVNHGFERSAAGTFKTFDPKGSTFTGATQINSSGLIAGSYTDKNNVSHGYIRTP